MQGVGGPCGHVGGVRDPLHARSTTALCSQQAEAGALWDEGVVAVRSDGRVPARTLPVPQTMLDSQPRSAIHPRHSVGRVSPPMRPGHDHRCGATGVRVPSRLTQSMLQAGVRAQACLRDCRLHQATPKARLSSRSMAVVFRAVVSSTAARSRANNEAAEAGMGCCHIA